MVLRAQQASHVVSASPIDRLCNVPMCVQIQDMIESGMEPQKIAEALLEQAERVREGLPATQEEQDEQEFFPDEIIIVRQCFDPF